MNLIFDWVFKFFYNTRPCIFIKVCAEIDRFWSYRCSNCHKVIKLTSIPLFDISNETKAGNSTRNRHLLHTKLPVYNEAYVQIGTCGMRSRKWIWPCTLDLFVTPRNYKFNLIMHTFAVDLIKPKLDMMIRTLRMEKIR